MLGIEQCTNTVLFQELGAPCVCGGGAGICTGASHLKVVIARMNVKGRISLRLRVCVSVFSREGFCREVISLRARWSSKAGGRLEVGMK